jgi:hypothetical protein
MGAQAWPLDLIRMQRRWTDCLDSGSASWRLVCFVVHLPSSCMLDWWQQHWRSKFDIEPCIRHTLIMGCRVRDAAAAARQPQATGVQTIRARVRHTCLLSHGRPAVQGWKGLVVPCWPSICYTADVHQLPALQSSHQPVWLQQRRH